MRSATAKTERKEILSAGLASPDPPAEAVAPENGFGIQASTQAIARLAYSYWEARGCQGGSAEDDWLRAEQELSSGN